MKKFFTLFVLLASTVFGLQAQRYLSPVFSDVTVTTDVTYGVNATVLLLAQAMQAVPQQLTCDIYEPTGDTETERPLVVLLHSGNFLPPSNNGGCAGTSKDAYMVDIATRLAKMGYVAAIANYRLGWNPIDPSQTTRVYTLINAAYRGVQDASTCIRFFRANHATTNDFKIDPDKIVLWGAGTGGYVSYAAATLDTITDTWIPKFTTPNGPMIIEQVNGNLEGTSVGIVFPGYPGFPAGDTLCYPNHVGFSSAFALGVNMGGSLGDTSWIDANDPPFISYHVPTDPFAPCETGIVNVPPPVSLPVVEVSGSCIAQQIFSRLGINDCIVAGGPYNDAISARARSLNGGIESFYPFVDADPTEGGRWDYSGSISPYGVAGVPPCDTNSVVGGRYLDTIFQYYAPRAFACLGLISSLDELTETEVGLQMSPNPSADFINIQTKADFPVEDVAIYDMNGKYLSGAFGLRQNSFQINRNGLNSGIYVVKFRFREGVVTRKIVFN